nr:aspartyl/asparaginyl beta-hydroxylase domain-containing protein [Burkholderiales bacterium]
LALPLMTVFPKERAVFTLLDIHEKCLEEAMDLIGSLGLSRHVAKCIRTDAVHYEIPAEEIPDVIVSETMSVTLHNEPQVSIARNLVKQAPNACMVPQSVTVEACLLNGSREHVPAADGNASEMPKRDRICLGKLFELDKANVRSWAGIEDDRLPAGSVKLPFPLESRYHPYLLTRITVYGDTCLQDYETSLTLPKPLRGQFNGGEELHFHYRLGSNPELQYEIRADDGQKGHSGMPSLFRRTQPAAPKTRYLRLPFSFDVVRLKDDVSKIHDGEWIVHANDAAYDMEWRCAPLRSVEGRADHILSLPGMRYEDTALLSRCQYIREVIDAFECEKTSVRLMALAPGSRINPHRDSGTSFEEGLARLHIPIVTAPEALFTIEGEEVHFPAGRAWYLNACCLHGVHNGSRQPRIHLMLDCVVNPWLEAIFLNAGFESGAKPKYEDASINDENVGAIIASLMDMDGETGKKLSGKLAAIRDAKS